MCGRYYIDDDITDDDIVKLIGELKQQLAFLDDNDKIRLSGEIFPTDIVPIIANNKSLAPTPFMMKWGYSVSWEKRRPIINARSETASEKTLFKEGMTKRRCLIPASNYFEWQKTKDGKVKFAIKPRGEKAMYMAGIYRFEDNKPVFTILTRSPGKNIAFIHDRMPVILPKEIHSDWLNINNEADRVIEAAMLDMEYKTA